MKQGAANTALETMVSLPVWEEWIETIWAGTDSHIAMSLPVWEEWIETCQNSGCAGKMASLPVWEEWIETRLAQSNNTSTIGLFPYGKSGLKHLFLCGLAPMVGLFPYGKSGLK